MLVASGKEVDFERILLDAAKADRKVDRPDSGLLLRGEFGGRRLRRIRIVSDVFLVTSNIVRSRFASNNFNFWRTVFALLGTEKF